MKKSAVAVTAAFLAASVVPAMALDAKFSGEMRTRGEYFNGSYLENQFYRDFNGSAGFTDADGNALTPPEIEERQDNNLSEHEGKRKSALWDSRMRMRMDLAVNENLKGVYVLQVGDITWGSQSPNNEVAYPVLASGLYADRRLRNDRNQNAGGRLNSNGVNLQTKNMYIDFNIPGLESVNTKVGILPLKVGHGIVLDGDASGLLIQHKSDMATIGAATFKTHEGDISRQDDSDYYLLFVNAPVQNNGSVGLFGIYNRNRYSSDDDSVPFMTGGGIGESNDDRLTQYWAGVTFDLNLDPIFINAEVDGYWAEIEQPDTQGADNDRVNGYAGYLNAGVNIKPVKAGVAGLYATGQSNSDQSRRPEYFSPIMPTRVHDNTLLNWDTIVLGQLKQNILTNLVSGKAYVEVSPMDTLTVGLSGQGYWLQQDSNLHGKGNGDYIGTEADVNITVRIYDNLVYRISGAYLWTNDEVFGISQGDTVATAKVTGRDSAPSVDSDDDVNVHNNAAGRDYKSQDIWFVGNQIVLSF